MNPTKQFVVPPADRTTLLSGPLGALLLVAGDQTEGRLSIVEHPLAPKTLGSPVHTHHNEDEYSLVLNGTIGVQIGEQRAEAGAGTALIKPRGIPHAFWNPTDEPAHLLEIISPAGFERYFAELGRILADAGGQPPDVDALAEVAARYDLELDPSSIPRLAAEHGLRLGPDA